jgi:hypothetical protein
VWVEDGWAGPGDAFCRLCLTISMCCLLSLSTHFVVCNTVAFSGGPAYLHCHAIL